ncbi:aminoglycoside phosphotransferase family protein [Streptacidiphilus neutrinimicus]|uniref:aminoglycoside phosphotransferase family protein n=1 Tax=Streptacidiphilus neutrinimicus TaxID=105420 RepID=UPI000693B64D|nr:aminoglycoside phosphotransferase family protein [Streptacidiphilus neutrinimicus]
MASGLCPGLTLWWLARRGEALAGFRHRNVAVDLGGTPVLLRTPRRQAYRFDQVVWSERTILESLKGRVDGAPQVLQGPLNSFTFTPGESLADRRLRGGLPEERIHAWLSAFFAELAAVPVDQLPTRPSDWPEDGDSQGFLREQVRYAREEMAPAVLRDYGTLLRGLSFPDDALQRFADRVPRLTSRPFLLLHGDLHAGNIIVSAEDGKPRLIDWELAMVGDPLHDLAMHLERFGYRNEVERRRVREIWRRAVRDVVPEAVKGLEADLRWYVGFQRVRSVYVDVVRTCEQFEVLGEKAACERLAEIVGRALPWIGVRAVLTDAQVREALTEWRGARRRVPARG